MHSLTQSPASVLICTVGTSLFYPNLAGLSENEHPKLAEAYADKDWAGVAKGLASVAPTERLCGAEINSIAALTAQGYAQANPRLFFLHSDTSDGASVGDVLVRYYKTAGLDAEAQCVTGLQDSDPAQFAREGLRNLARLCCRIVREYSPEATAINATGGYKAQVAIGVLLGQALGTQVYYKHERFDYIIPFPPMPVALDFDYWMEVSGILYDLAQVGADPPTWNEYDTNDRERLQALINEVSIDGNTYLELSPTGQIFHEAFHQRFRARMDQLLPPPVPRSDKKHPIIEASGHVKSHPEIMRFMEDLTEALGPVRRCATYYYNPNLSQRSHCRLGGKGVEIVFSNGSYTTKIRVDTSAKTQLEQQAVVTMVNQWMAAR